MKGINEMNTNKFDIQFLGTCAADYNHIHNCESENCRKARQLGGRNIRRAPMLFIAPNYLIDFSAEAQKQLALFDIAPVQIIEHLIITHGHGDHFEPLVILDFAQKRKTDLGQPLNIYGNHKICDSMQFAATQRIDETTGKVLKKSEEYSHKWTDEMSIALFELKLLEKYHIGDLTIIPIQANHCINKTSMVIEEMALNYIIQRGGKTILYATDTSSFLQESFDEIKKYQFDLFIIEGTFGNMEIDPITSGHHNFAMLEETIKELKESGVAKPKAQFVATHISLQKATDAPSERDPETWRIRWAYGITYRHTMKLSRFGRHAVSRWHTMGWNSDIAFDSLVFLLIDCFASLRLLRRSSSQLRLRLFCLKEKFGCRPTLIARLLTPLILFQDDFSVSGQIASGVGVLVGLRINSNIAPSVSSVSM